MPSLPTFNGLPYATIDVASGLAPGATSGEILGIIIDPSNASIGYNTMLFAGAFY
jgi:hypothetical protein